MRPEITVGHEWGAVRRSVDAATQIMAAFGKHCPGPER